MLVSEPLIVCGELLLLRLLERAQSVLHFDNLGLRLHEACITGRVVLGQCCGIGRRPDVCKFSLRNAYRSDKGRSEKGAQVLTGGRGLLIFLRNLLASR